MGWTVDLKLSPSDLASQLILFCHQPCPELQVLVAVVFTWSLSGFFQVEAPHPHLHNSTPGPVPSDGDPPPEGRCWP